MKQMNDKVFIDTNLLIYFVDVTDERQKLVTGKLSQYENCFISVQVLNEFIKTWDLKNKYDFSYYDSLIISAALQIGCNILFTEDMQNGQIIENTLTIINPFK